MWARSRSAPGGIGEAFAYEHLDLWPPDGEQWEVNFGHISIGFREATPPRFEPRRRSKGPMRLAYLGDA